LNKNEVGIRPTSFLLFPFFVKLLTEYALFDTFTKFVIKFLKLIQVMPISWAVTIRMVDLHLNLGRVWAKNAYVLCVNEANCWNCGHKILVWSVLKSNTKNSDYQKRLMKLLLLPSLLVVTGAELSKPRKTTVSQAAPDTAGLGHGEVGHK